MKYSLDGINYQTKNTFDSLSSGDFTIYIKNINGCILEEKITIKSHFGPEPQIVKTQNETCHGTDGQITAKGKSGIGNLTYALNDSEFGTSSTFKNLKKGDYTITVKDEAGCFSFASIFLPYNESPKITKVSISPTTCGKNNGAIEINVKANSHVEYALNKNKFSSETSFKNVPKGEHHVFVKNDDACFDSVIVEIPASKALKIASIMINQPNCIDSLGVIEIITSGGENDLMYSIDGVYFQKNNRFQNLKADTYRPKIRNSNGCLDEAEVQIQEVSQLLMENIRCIPANCGKANGQVVFEIKNSEGHLNTFIDNERTISGTVVDSLWTGAYRISVTDEKGCKVDSVLTIGQGDCPVHIPNSFSPNEDGDNDFYKIFTDANLKGKLLSFSIYNQWGSRIYYRENFKSGDNLWDGRLQVEFESGKTETINGALTLVR